MVPEIRRLKYLKAGIQEFDTINVMAGDTIEFTWENPNGASIILCRKLATKTQAISKVLVIITEDHGTRKGTILLDDEYYSD